MKKFSLLLLATLLATANSASSIVAVLEITPSSDDVNLSISEYRHLTDELRTKARETLPPAYTILTRDNIFQLLPPDEKEAECLAASCAVDIGRAIGAEYVSQGSIGRFQGMLTLTVELYESMSGNMLGSFVTENKDALGLLNTVREKAPALFAKILPPPPPIPTNIPPTEPKKSNTSMWVAIGLDVLGAAAIGFGLYKNVKANDYHNELIKLKNNVQLNDYDSKKLEFEDNNKKMQDAGTARNIFYATGGALLVSGMALHFWF